MPATYADKPTSEWEYSHALSEGDALVDVDSGAGGRVKYVRDDGSVCVTWEGGEEDHTEEEITRCLADSIVETEDGLSYELATF